MQHSESTLPGIPRGPMGPILPLLALPGGPGGPLNPAVKSSNRSGNKTNTLANTNKLHAAILGLEVWILKLAVMQNTQKPKCQPL